MGHWYDEDIPIVAAKRRGVLPQKEKVTKHAKKHARPYKIWTVASPYLRRHLGSKPYVTHRSTTRQAAEAWIEKQRRSGCTNAYTITGPNE